MAASIAVLPDRVDGMGNVAREMSFLVIRARCSNDPVFAPIAPLNNVVDKAVERDLMLFLSVCLPK